MCWLIGGNTFNRLTGFIIDLEKNPAIVFPLYHALTYWTTDMKTHEILF